MDYVAEITARGCFVGFDRIYRNGTGEYYKDKARDIAVLCEKGYGDNILLSHDTLTFGEFDVKPVITDCPIYDRVFTHLLPAMKEAGFTQNDIERFIMQKSI